MNLKFKMPGESVSPPSYNMLKIMALIMIISNVETSEDYKGNCPLACHCQMYYHPTDEASIHVECMQGGMTAIPVKFLNRSINQLIITSQPRRPNFLTIGPILTQPEPFSNLRVLMLTNSNIPSIGQYSFWGLRNLKTLNLTGNNITNISMDNFRGLVSLTILVLDYNNIEQMASETFRHMPSLTRLSLAHNKITTLGPRLFRMLDKLEVLNLSFNPLLDLNPDVFLDIQNIVTLKCRQCNLRRVNVQIYHIAPLIEELDLGYNLFKFLTDDDFNNLKKLKKLKLDHNQISVVVENAFKGNGQLQDLGLSHNRIAMLAPGSLNNLSKLNSLDISYNRLEKFRLQAFGPVSKSLTSINFSGNYLPLHEISMVLQLLPKIMEVGLSNLSFKYIPPNIFMYNKHLISLDLSSNSLSQFPITLLTNTRYLQYLDISNNKLSYLKEEHLHRLEAIANIDMSANKWTCDECTLKSALVYMNTTVLKDTLRGLQCYQPKKLRGVYFSELNSKMLEPCFSSLEAKMSIAAGFLLVLMSILTTAAIVLCCTRRRSAQYYTNEQKRRERDPEHPEELLVTPNHGNVSTIHSPCHHVQNHS